MMNILYMIFSLELVEHAFSGACLRFLDRSVNCAYIGGTLFALEDCVEVLSEL